MFNIDYRLDIPIYEQICSGYENLIKCEVLKAGDKMPSVREIASQLSINPNTAQKAMSLMESKGLIYSVRGKGSFVSEEIKFLKTQDFIRITQEIAVSVQKLISMGFNTEEIKDTISKILDEEGKI